MYANSVKEQKSWNLWIRNKRATLMWVNICCTSYSSCIYPLQAFSLAIKVARVSTSNPKFYLHLASLWKLNSSPDHAKLAKTFSITYWSSGIEQH